MDNNLEYLIDTLIDTLIELRSASMQTNENTLYDLMHKYDMLFLGSKFNSIYSHELLHHMKSNADFNISENEFLELIPKACKVLEMKCEPMIKVSDLENPNAKTSCYSILLW